MSVPKQNYLTITIPFYSNLPFLEAAVQSVLRQDCPDWRLVIVDDCGPELNVKKYIDSLKDKRISYLRNTVNLGLAGNWNQCLEVADSDLVSLLHSDDILAPGYVRTFLRTAHQFPHAAALFCRAIIIDQQGRTSMTVADTVKNFLTPKQKAPLVLHGEAAITSLLKGNYIVCPTLCYRRSIIKSERFQTSLKMVLDFEFTSRLLLNGHTLVGLNDELYCYRRHASNMTNELSRTLIRSAEECWLWNNLQLRLKKHGWIDAAHVANRKTIVKLTLGYLIFSDLLHLKPRAAWNKLVFMPTLWEMPQTNE